MQSLDNRDHVVLAVVDLSGSMAGQSVSTAQIQIQELFSALKSTQDHSSGLIRFGLMGFHERTQWLIKPEDIDKINDLPILQITPTPSGLYPKTNCIAMLQELNRSLTPQFLCGRSLLKSLNIILISDGFPTDRTEKLRATMSNLRNNEVFSDSHCRRFVIRDEFDVKKARVNYGRWFLEEFVGNTDNMVSAEGFSALTSRISADLIGDIPSSVF